MPAKLLAISDIEGNMDALVRLLVANHVTDTALSWTYGDGHLVLVGDFVDRGINVTQCLWLIYKLEQEAEKAGGKVHYILGNHEQLNLQGYGKYAQPKYYELLRRLKIEYGELYATDTELGRWLRTKNVIEQIGGYIFVHGGLNKQLADAGRSVQQINTVCRLYIDSRKNKDIADSTAQLLTGNKGILWYRGLVSDYKDYTKISQQEIDYVLQKLSAKGIVIGHTIVDKVSTDFGGRVIRLDVKHSEQEPEGILMTKGKIYRINTKGEALFLAQGN